MNERVRELIEELGGAIDETVNQSSRVESIMQAIRDCGYEIYLTLEANIAVENKFPQQESSSEDKFSDEDLKFLRRLKISF